MKQELISEVYHTSGIVVLWYENGEQKYKIIKPEDCPDKWYRCHQGLTNKKIHGYE